ncbi:MAG: hypothetical protein LAP39_23240 [Acidobacteriia bacterium]|nr:hypothetical protein [Terriglobia bacterium]
MVNDKGIGNCREKNPAGSAGLYITDRSLGRASLIPGEALKWVANRDA